MPPKATMPTLLGQYLSTSATHSYKKRARIAKRDMLKSLSKIKIGSRGRRGKRVMFN